MIVMNALRVATIAVAILVTSACDRVARWDVTVEVSTPSGPVYGSAVVETRERDAIEFMGSMDTFKRRVRGQAVVVDLGGQKLFALVEGEGKFGFWRWAGDCYGRQFTSSQIARSGITPDDPFTAAQRTSERRCRADEAVWRTNAERAIANEQSFELPRANWPRFAHFRDESDRVSLEEENPSNLSEAVYPGLYVSRVIIRPTNKRVKTDIVDLLPWLKEQQGSLDKSGHGKPMSESTFAGRVTEGDFVRQ